jgi:hypothetical protein
MFNFLKKHSLVLIFFALSIIVYNKWIFYLGILTSGDWVSFYKETLASIRVNYFSLWAGDTFGRVLLDVGQAPTWAAYGFLAKYLGLDFSLSERLIHLWPIAIMTPLFSYLLLKRLFSSKIAIFVGVLVYSFNTYFLVLQTGHLTLMTAFSLAPLIILKYMDTLRSLKLKDALFTGLLLFIAGAYEPRALYIIAWVLFIYFIYYLFCVNGKGFKNNFLKICIKGFIPICIFILLNFYWTFGLLKMNSLLSNEILGRGLFGNEFLNINYALTLFHPFWTGKELTIFTIQPIPLYFWTIPLFAFLGLWLNRKNKNILFFGLVALVGIFLTKQVAHPFPEIYPWLNKHLIGFNAFRESSKFYFLIILGYSVLIAGFIDWLWKNWKNTKFQIFGKYILICIIAFIFLWNTKPLITGDLGSLFVPRKIPKDYLIVKDFISKQPDFFRMLGAPIGSRYIFSSNNHPEAGWELFDYVNAHSLYEKENTDKLSIGEIRIRLMKKSYSNNLINISSVKYVFVPILDKINDGDLFINYGKSRDYYIGELDKISYLHKINIGAKEIVVYENYNYRPHIYITNNQETISKEQAYKTIDYKFVNPTEYTFSAKNVSTPFYLNFSESFNSGWDIRIGSFNWFRFFKNNNYFISDKYHFQNDVGLNSYVLDPKSICKQFACKQNKDGSYDISGTLYFSPQSYMNFGLIISGGTLILVLCFLSFTFGKHIYERKN